MVLEWLREDPSPSLDEVAGRLAKLSPKASPTEADAVLQAKDYVKQLYRSLYDQGLIKNRDVPCRVGDKESRSGIGPMAARTNPHSPNVGTGAW